jgi:hypothetical protein
MPLVVLLVETVVQLVAGAPVVKFALVMGIGSARSVVAARMHTATPASNGAESFFIDCLFLLELPSRAFVLFVPPCRRLTNGRTTV